jgi:hypothetical protein
MDQEIHRFVRSAVGISGMTETYVGAVGASWKSPREKKEMLIQEKRVSSAIFLQMV